MAFLLKLNHRSRLLNINKMFEHIYLGYLANMCHCVGLDQPDSEDLHCLSCNLCYMYVAHFL